MTKRLILAAALAAMPLAALAERPPQYFGINGGWFEVQTDAPFEDDGEFVNVRLGYELGRFLAFEARFGMDTGSAKTSAGTYLDTRQGAVFARLNLPFEGVDVYALGGAGRVSFNDDTGRNAEEWPAAGLGIELYGSERTAVVLEAVRYEGDDEGDYKAYTLGFKRHFNWPQFRR